MRIFISNLSSAVSEEEIRREFQAFGEVTSVIIAKNRDGDSRGYCFVEMLKTSDGQTAIANLNGKSFKEYTLVVSAARDWSELGGKRPRRSRKNHKSTGENGHNT